MEQVIVERDINIAYQAYACHPCEAALEAVMERGEPLVRYFARMYGCGCCFDDLCQTGMLGLMKAVKSYDGRVLFSTWASCCVIGEIRHFTRREQSYRSAVQLMPAQADADAEPDARLRPAYQSFHLAVEDRVMLEQALRKLDVLQKKVIAALFFRGLSQEQAAKELGLNQRKVSRIKEKSCGIMTEMFSEIV